MRRIWGRDVGQYFYIQPPRMYVLDVPLRRKSFSFSLYIGIEEYPELTTPWSVSVGYPIIQYAISEYRVAKYSIGAAVSLCRQKSLISSGRFKTQS